MIYALTKASGSYNEEGLKARFARHELHSNALKAGLQAMGLSLFAQEDYRAPMLTTVRIPEGVDDARVRKSLMDSYRLEIGGGLGPPLRGEDMAYWAYGPFFHTRKRRAVSCCTGGRLACGGLRFPTRSGNRRCPGGLHMISRRFVRPNY